MDGNVPDSNFLARLSREINQNLLSPNTDGNISDPDFPPVLLDR